MKMAVKVVVDALGLVALIALMWFALVTLSLPAETVL